MRPAFGPASSFDSHSVYRSVSVTVRASSTCFATVAGGVDAKAAAGTARAIAAIAYLARPRWIRLLIGSPLRRSERTIEPR